MKQLVLSGNRVIAHGEDCFLAMGGTVICLDTGRKFENATVAECEGCPSDIDQRGYEYHAGTFVPCAPYGKGDGNLAVVCGDDCKAIKDSGVALGFLMSLKRVRVITYKGTGSSTVPDLGLEFPPSAIISIGSSYLSVSINGEGFAVESGGANVYEFNGMYNSVYNNKSNVTYNAIAFE